MQIANSELDPVLERFFDRAVGQIPVPQRDAQRTRRLRVAPLLGSAAAVAVILIGALVVGRTLNDARGGVGAEPSASASTTPTTIERQPVTLAQLTWEAAVNDAFRAGGLQVRTIGASVAESALGPVLPARSFIVRPGPVAGGLGIGADVVFVKGAGLGTITVCASPGSAPGRMTYITSVGGQRVLSEDAVAPEYHLVSADYFVIAYDTASRDALQRGLSLVPPSCPTTAPRTPEVSADRKSISDDQVVLAIDNDQIVEWFHTESQLCGVNTDTTPGRRAFCTDRATFKDRTQFTSVVSSPDGMKIGFTIGSDTLAPDTVAGIYLTSTRSVHFLTTYYIGNQFISFSPTGAYFVYQGNCFEDKCGLVVRDASSLADKVRLNASPSAERTQNATFIRWISDNELEYKLGTELKRATF